MTNKVQIKKNFVVEKMEGKTTLFDVDTSTFFSFNETGSHIFNMIKKGATLEQIADSLVRKYEVTRPSAIKDVKAFVKGLLKNKIAYEPEQKKRSK